MFEEKDEALEMGNLQLAVDTIKRMRDGVGDLPGVKIALQGKNVIAKDHDVRVLRFGDSPDEDVNLARILRKIGRNLLADECIRQIRDFEATIDRIVVRDRDVIHPALEQLPVQFPGIGETVRKIESAKEPFLRTRAVARMNMEVALAHL